MSKSLNRDFPDGSSQLPTMVAQWAYDRVFGPEVKDPAFRPEFVDRLWTETFPDAEIMRLADAGHYLQEDAYEQIVPALLDFLKAPKPSAT